MAEQKNQFISLSYQLYIDGDEGQEMMEEAPAERPFQFITGLGIALDAFESQVINLAKDDTFDFSIPKEQAYGDYNDELLLELARETFSFNGHFDHEHIYEDAVVPLQDEEGRRFYGRIVEVGEEKVKVDLNNPLAGETLYFKGKVLENRPATIKEIEHMAKHLAGGCGGHCDDCGGCSDDCGCDHDHEHGGGCGCGHCH
jgi:FKBP-type peptidyl-prolyl cis-trans isomerase SlyD